MTVTTPPANEGLLPSSRIPATGIATCAIFAMTDSRIDTAEPLESLGSLGGPTRRELLRPVWGGINRNDLINRAYELACNSLLAVFPMLLFLLGLLGIFAREGSQLRSDLFYYFQLVLLPAASKLLIQTLDPCGSHSRYRQRPVDLRPAICVVLGILTAAVRAHSR